MDDQVNDRYNPDKQQVDDASTPKIDIARPEFSRRNMGDILHLNGQRE